MPKNKRENVEAVIKDIYHMTLTAALKIHDVDASTFFRTVKEVPSLSLEYVHAQQDRAELLVDELIDIADNSEDPQKARNQIDVRKWAASKMKPDKFGDRIDVNLNQTVDIKGALSEALARVRPVLEIEKPQLVETIEVQDTRATGSQPAETGSTAKNELDELLE